MKIGLVVDSGCDLPKDFIDANNILVMPVPIRIGKEIYVDDRDPQRAREFYAPVSYTHLTLPTTLVV